MVIISAVLGNVITTLIQKSTVAENILYCGNNNSLLANGFPNFNYSSPLIYGANVTDGKSVNYIRVSSNVASSGPPSLGASYPCKSLFEISIEFSFNRFY